MVKRIRTPDGSLIVFGRKLNKAEKKKVKKARTEARVCARSAATISPTAVAGPYDMSTVFEPTSAPGTPVLNDVYLPDGSIDPSKVYMTKVEPI